MMKNLFYILAFCLLAQTAQAQLFSREKLSNLETFDNRFLTWGYYLGFNQYDFKIDYENDLGDQETDIDVETQMGFNVGLIGDMRINKYMNLRLEPGIYFTNRNLRFPGFEEENDELREVKSTYIHVPLLLKLSTKRINNFKPFIVMGVSRSINLASNEKNPEDNFEGQFRMRRSTGYYELGFGIDLYLYYFKFTPSIRGVFATSDELVPDDSPFSPWTSNISSLKTRGIFLNFTFQ
tara:strand:- start:20320 stop:21030 length:711 start_codon:yes stop_codon:yes gene_type:complete